MALTPFTRITLVLPIPRRYTEQSRALRMILNDLVQFCGGVTYSSTESPFLGIWRDDLAQHQRAQSILIISDTPRPINDSLLIAYLEYMKLRAQRVFGEEIIWLTIHSIARISTHDNDSEDLP